MSVMATEGIGTSPGNGYSPHGRDASDDQSDRVTGFEPRDLGEPAPDRVSSAIDVFQPAPPSAPTVAVDPLGAVSDKERKQHDEKVEGIVQAQRDAESLVGVTLRR